MNEILSKRASSKVLTEEENLLDWNEVLKNFKITFRAIVGNVGNRW